MAQANVRDLEKEIEATRVLREQLGALCEGDPEFLHDSIEGETNLFEVISALAAADGEDDALIQALDEYIKKLKARKDRIEHRQETRRAMMANALEIAEQRTLETAAGTVTRKFVAPKLIIIEESEIPSKFFEPQPPKLDKTELARYLRARAKALAELRDNPDDKAASSVLETYSPIDGAQLSNGSYTISIKRS